MIADQRSLRTEEPAEFWLDPRARLHHRSRLKTLLEPLRRVFWRITMRLTRYGWGPDGKNT